VVALVVLVMLQILPVAAVVLVLISWRVAHTCPLAL